MDDYLRTHAAFIKQVNDASVKTTGDQTVAGIKTFSSAPVVPGLNGGQLAGMRNKIVNGAMKIDQRNAGASQTFTAGAALAYAVDRWYGYCTGANITGQRVAISNGQNRYRFTGAASNTAVGFGQRIEAVNCLDLAGSTATLSVKLSSSSLTSITWTAYYANSADTFGTLASPTRTQIATGTFTINSTEATYSANVSVPSAATTGIEIVLTGGALLGTQTLTIGDVQFEIGSLATPFEHRPFGAELALCQRYYEIGTSRNAVMWSGNATSGVTYFSNKGFSVPKRATPTTVTTSNEVIVGFAAGAPTLDVDAQGIQANKTANTTVAPAYYFYDWQASAEL